MLRFLNTLPSLIVVNNLFFRFSGAKFQIFNSYKCKNKNIQNGLAIVLYIANQDELIHTCVTPPPVVV